MQQAYTLKTLITNTIRADTPLGERDRHRRRRKGPFVRDSGQIPFTEAQNEHRRRRNVRFFGDDGLCYRVTS